MDVYAMYEWLSCYRQWNMGIAQAAVLGLTLATLAVSSAWAGSDCASLEIQLKDSAEFRKIECDQHDFSSGGIFGTEEMIRATSPRSLLVVRHLIAGNRTYLIESSPQKLIERGFDKSEDWAAAPGGGGFVVMRFRGWLKSQPTHSLACFGFARFTGHVDHSPGYRHGLSGFYCTDQMDAVSDADTRRLMASMKFDFE